MNTETTRLTEMNVLTMYNYKYDDCLACDVTYLLNVILNLIRINLLLI